MKKTLLLFILVLCSCMYVQAQTGTVKGTITDSSSKENLANASVSLLRSKDSVLYKFSRAAAGGDFDMKNIAAGKYLVYITYPNYADYQDKLEVPGNGTLDLGKIFMITKANLLQEVIVRQRVAAIRIKGDTTEFNADSFKVREGASVEEMLKKLPGIQVDKDGKITAMGEKVNKVLVDGEEFFGDDPTVATKNLQADAIDKVQVFDKKSDQAEFTGIDDGERSKTINLKLKEDKKKGYFGKLELGGGLDDRWNNSAMINNFKAKRKVSAYGIMSSTGKTGLDWQESNQYGSSSSGPEYNDDFGGFMMFGDNDEFENSSYYGEGVPKSWAGGINFSNKFGDDKQNLNGSYRFNKLNSLGSGSTVAQSILPDTVFINNNAGSSFSSRQRHSINGTYDWNIDSSSSIKIKANGYRGTTINRSNSIGNSTNETGKIVNRSVLNNSSDGDNSSIQSSLLYRKKFKKAGRSISFSFEQGYNDKNTDGFLYAENTFYDKTGGISLSDTTDQKKTNAVFTSSLNGKVVYTEPLTKKLFLEVNYGLRSTHSDAEKLSFDNNGVGKYNVLNDSFSNHYLFNVLSNVGGVTFKYNGKKLTLTAGNNISLANYTQTDQLRGNVLKRDFTNFFPRAGLTYKFTQSSRLSINYNGNTKQPTIDQIQPIPDNSDPLSIKVGNPLLDQEFDHRINFNFNAFKVLSQRGIFFYGSFQLQSNAIVTSTTTNTTDSAGKTIYKYLNTDGNYNYYAGLNYYIKLKKLDMGVNFGLDANGSRYSNFVNDQKNTTNNTSAAVNFGFNKDKEKKYNIYYYGNFRYNISTSSVNTAIETKYWTQDHNLGITVQLPKKFEVNSEVQSNFRQKTDLFTGNNNVILWNAYIGRKLLKNDKAIIKVSGYDILNQNKGYSRYISSNILQESRYQTLTRYFLLSFVWNFSKNAAGTPSAPNQ